MQHLGGAPGGRRHLRRRHALQHPQVLRVRDGPDPDPDAKRDARRLRSDGVRERPSLPEALPFVVLYNLRVRDPVSVPRTAEHSVDARRADVATPRERDKRAGTQAQRHDGDANRSRRHILLLPDAGADFARHLGVRARHEGVQTTPVVHPE